ncbi:MAG: AAA family ATPase [Proteobacteria bacterium]|nr:AAA family ATPase [Pseudomonadota bacterium]MCP4917537.1 AAA family ATPase [Pseudomonadota bacterium]
MPRRMLGSPAMKAVVERVRELVRARYPLLYLLTYEEERIERNLRKLGKDEDLPVLVWTKTDGLREKGKNPVAGTTDPQALLDALGARKEPGLIVLRDFHHDMDDPWVRRKLRDLEPQLGTRRQAILFISPVLALPREVEKDVVVIDVPLPGRDEVGKLLAHLLKRRKQTMDAALFERFVAASLGLTEKELKRTFAHISLTGGTFDEGRLNDLIEAKRQAIRKSRYLEFWDEQPGLESVGGLGNLKEWLTRRQAAFSQDARKFGLPEPKGVFLLGVQGCGKSLMAKAVAGEFKIPLLRLDVGALFETGGVEDSLRDTIRVAESISPAVLWIDELEKGFLGDGGAGSAFGTFLTWLQEKTKPVFVVATANEVRTLPPELLRKGRFDEIFFVDLPNVHERLTILDIHLRNRGRDPEKFDLFGTAEETEKYSGAELEQVVVEGLFNAYAEEREMTGRDLVRVVRDTVPLAITMDDKLKELREWARPRTRPASKDRRRIDFFEDFQEG